MTRKTTRWGPGTCECIVDLYWDDAVSLDQRVFVATNIVHACRWHQDLQEPARLYPVLVAEKQRRDDAVAAVRRTFPDVEVAAHYDHDHILEIMVTDLTSRQVAELEASLGTSLPDAPFRVVVTDRAVLAGSPSQNVHFQTCYQCRADLSGQEPGDPCPQCGSRRSVLGMRGFSMASRGPSTIELPIFSQDPRGTTVRTEGDVDFSLAQEKATYRFAGFKKIKRRSGKNWVQVKLRRDGRGLDVLFGRRPGGEHHSHYSYEPKPRMIYLRDQVNTQLVRQVSFIGESGAFVPVQDSIDDKETGMRLVLRFALKDGHIAIDSVEFVLIEK